LSDRGIPVTAFGIASALDRNPHIVETAVRSGWEIASHGLKWIDYATMPEHEERRQIQEAVAVHTRATGSRPTGWYTGRMSPATRRLVVEEGGFLYDSDSFADDLPYWVDVDGIAQLVVPYTLDNNDGRYVNSYGFQAPSFSAYLIDAFELLIREGSDAPRLMNVGLHLRLSGKPGRAADLERFLDHISGRDDVWITRRIDIAEHWRREHPAESWLPGSRDPHAR
jgi:peptidoglycan/xylan/chitin deacetylase (PgdA/CDA1 family)